MEWKSKLSGPKRLIPHRCNKTTFGTVQKLSVGVGIIRALAWAIKGKGRIK